MQTINLGKYCFEYNHDNIYCFFDEENQRIAFQPGLLNEDFSLVIDFVDNQLTFHPNSFVNIIELDDCTYRIISDY
ncbi:hypothetical protein DY120_01125 [Apilactobacillus micheneri]|uniref:Uncharacterized protein n=1 Tax=Apilactobacillus micheneri TaxID=1899430 RepID=A0ABY2YYE6_9LACO|nr:hypothetical protein [Apilactobacillus micheneri]TPR26328.1 hypothetical protein DY114_01125 [Apilactobacillus micheneri]TPR27082.1 hypothetical protein DY111_01125 [Apilactobacillus micheneri]TPR27940.1 hypothetical protein DY113_04900 [Apilactobacillus micheneri]TPR31845.1 hypothetical protein DY117_01125 [Apilactobacillus micheneri]TPR32249.1 hypothetical protein DY120_01125 [Apilactobacillus micheneri]